MRRRKPCCLMRLARPLVILFAYSTSPYAHYTLIGVRYVPLMGRTCTNQLRWCAAGTPSRASGVQWVTAVGSVPGGADTLWLWAVDGAEPT